MEIATISPGTFGYADHLDENLARLKSKGLNLDDTTFSRGDDESHWRFSSGSVESRLEELNAALNGPHEFIWASRGGYGCSDLLPKLDFESLKQTHAKIIIGFSDIVALQSAFYTKLGWQSLHAMMPASPLWVEGQYDDAFCATTRSILDKNVSNHVNVSTLSKHDSVIKGTLFGGCFSVLTNLIGTPYLPADFAGHILFFEDVGENPGKLLRYANQWSQSGLWKNVSAIVFGAFENCFSDDKEKDLFIAKVQDLTGAPILKCDQFGHIVANFPLGIGCRGWVEGQKLFWSFKS